MKWKDFKANLVAHGMSQGQFARLTGQARERPSKWAHNKDGVPIWVKSWFKLFSLLPAKLRQRLSHERGFLEAD